MKVRDRVDVLADLFLGAVYADGVGAEDEKCAVRGLLKELLVMKELPPAIESRISSFDPKSFDLAKVAADFASDPPMNKRRLLELVARVCLADGILDLEEDAYVRRLGTSLGLAPDEFADLVLDYEIEELRKSFADIRYSQIEVTVEK
jgi:uncharacterized tellurite resistance protein B-like protein